MRNRFTNGANDGIFQVTSKPSDDKIIVGGGTLVTETGFIREAGATPSAFVRSINLSLDNGLRLQRAVGAGAGAVGVGLGDADVTGSALVITLPRVRLSSFGLPVNGPNEELEQTFDLEAEFDPTTNATIQFDYFAA